LDIFIFVVASNLTSRHRQEMTSCSVVVTQFKTNPLKELLLLLKNCAFVDIR